MTPIVACGLKREAREIAAAGGDVRIIAGGGDAARLEAELEAAVLALGAPAPLPTPDHPDRPRQSTVLILSSGIAGALDPALQPGDIVLDGDPGILAILRRALPHASIGAIAGGDAIVATAAAKYALRETTGAIAADMESHVASRVATRHGLRFAALRTISDTADETLPPAALIGMKPDGGMALGAVLASLARHPTQLPALIRTGIGAGKAFRALGRAHHALGGLRVELADLGQLRLDMA